VQVGTPIGIYAGYLVPVALALLLGTSLALDHPDRSWARTGVTAAALAGAMAVLLVVRYMTSPTLGTDRGAIVAVVAAIAVLPAAMVLSARRTAFRERASHLSLALLPAASLTLFAQPMPDATLPVALVAVALGWQLMPVERATELAGLGLSRMRSQAPHGTSVGATRPISRELRDLAVGAVFAVVMLAGLLQASATYVVLGVALAVLVGFALRTGYLGARWVDAAVPIGAAVGLPVMLATFAAWDYGGAMGWVVTVLVLSGLGVAHALASRHSDPRWSRRLLLWAAALGVGSILLDTVLSSGANEGLAFAIAALIPLVPGLPVAFADDRDAADALSTRVETLAVALTPAVAATILTDLAWVPLAAWLTAIVVWRRFTLAPLLGLARRTQLQRDVAVAAAETERARLAADLHDDALQQLTMLVRTLDEGGHAAEADEAREIAMKLRSVVGDLRLPILDDLGAGAALEWLVERVEPLAGGAVKLERSDEARPPANVELAVFRVAQEALTNAIKHGRPPIAVRYDVRSDGRVTLAIDDAGEGIGSDAAEEAPKVGHFGLVNMQQRAEQIGALLDVRRWPSGGTRVALEWRPQ
jgi:signal transduction histidine kinase